MRSRVRVRRHCDGSVRALLRGELVAGVVDRLPQRRPARGQVARAAELRGERRLELRAQQRAQVLVDVLIRPPVNPLRVEFVTPSSSDSSPSCGPRTGEQHRVGDLRPDGVHDRRAAGVDLAVGVAVEAARRPAPATRAAGRASARPARSAPWPVCRSRRAAARVSTPGRPASPRRSSPRSPRPAPLAVLDCQPVEVRVEQVDALDRAVAVHSSSAAPKPGRRLLFQLVMPPARDRPAVRVGQSAARKPATRTGRCRSSAGPGRRAGRAAAARPPCTRDVLVVDVERVERLRRSARRPRRTTSGCRPGRRTGGVK